jgi:hypothetical protein
VILPSSSHLLNVSGWTPNKSLASCIEIFGIIQNCLTIPRLT